MAQTGVVVGRSWWRWIQVPACWVTLGKFLNLFRLCFIFCKIGILIIILTLQDGYWGPKINVNKGLCKVWKDYHAVVIMLLQACPRSHSHTAGIWTRSPDSEARALRCTSVIHLPMLRDVPADSSLSLLCSYPLPGAEGGVLVRARYMWGDNQACDSKLLSTSFLPPPMLSFIHSFIHSTNIYWAPGPCGHGGDWDKTLPRSRG